jgi:CBS domain-containing protein
MVNTENTTNQEQFRRLFQRFEKHLATKYGSRRGSSMTRLIERFWEREADKCLGLNITKDDLWNLKRIRNVDAHDQALINIGDKAVAMLEKLVKAFCAKARDIATPAKGLFIAELSTSINDAVALMSEKRFTHVPVVDSGRFYGLFSGKTLLHLVAAGRDIKGLKMKDIVDNLGSDEDEETYEFLPADADYYEVFKLFENYIERGQKLGVIFLTPDGQPSGQIMGLITAWDLSRG